MKHVAISFIGAGNMARSLIGGLLGGDCSAQQLRAADPNPEARQTLTEHYPGIFVTHANGDVLADADAIVIAVKPPQVRAVLEEIQPVIARRQPLVVSIAAGVRAEAISRWLGGTLPVVRLMPNTPALVGAGATGLYAMPGVDEAQRSLAENLARAVGATFWVDDEAQMDTLTAVSGSGPAYFFLVIEALEEAAVEQGLPAQTARLLALQTAFGATKLALEHDAPAAELRRRVTSKGGTTEQALAALEDGGLRDLLARAVTAAKARSNELAQQLGAD